MAHNDILTPFRFGNWIGDWDPREITSNWSIYQTFLMQNSEKELRICCFSITFLLCVFTGHFMIGGITERSAVVAWKKEGVIAKQNLLSDCSALRECINIRSFVKSSGWFGRERIV